MYIDVCRYISRKKDAGVAWNVVETEQKPPLFTTPTSNTNRNKKVD